jgi:hypothetical protein
MCSPHAPGALWVPLRGGERLPRRVARRRHRDHRCPRWVHGELCRSRRIYERAGGRFWGEYPSRQTLDSDPELAAAYTAYDAWRGAVEYDEALQRGILIDGSMVWRRADRVTPDAVIVALLCARANPAAPDPVTRAPDTYRALGPPGTLVASSPLQLHAPPRPPLREALAA